jgi:hypothetical protein
LKWVFWGVWVGSYVVKRFDDFQNFLRKVEQCTAFEISQKEIQYGVGEEKLYFPDYFF